MTPNPDDWKVEIVRSGRRKKTISAEVKGDTLIIRAPRSMSDRELRPHIDSLKARLAKKIRRATSQPTDEALQRMAQTLNRRYFAGKLRWNTIRFVSNQNKRFGSCTPSTGSIRISDRLATMPKWVLEYVVMHELAHLLEANHGENFWALVNQYPKTERARGYLMAVGLENLDTNELG
jgi:hypothetical protein